MRALLGAAAALCAPALPALAHPHIWIDARVEVILDDADRAVALRIGWTYDEFYSLSLMADRGLDPELDGVLTPQEAAALQGFDMNWDPGFPGDTYALLGETELALSRPQEVGAAWDGLRLTSTHLRRLDTPVDIGAGPLLVQVYDPGFYTAYAIAFDPVLTGGSGGCSAEVWVPDRDAADEALLAALAEFSADVDIEAEFPAIGKEYAEEVRVTCAAR
jgi:ABC-type uncharacterized transport system substrate-binding protein